MVTKDDIETMRILFGADINELCNQGRWKDAKEMEQIRDRLMEALKDRPTGEWIEKEDAFGDTFYNCSICGESWSTIDGEPWNNGMKYCPNCGAKMQ